MVVPGHNVGTVAEHQPISDFLGFLRDVHYSTDLALFVEHSLSRNDVPEGRPSRRGGDRGIDGQRNPVRGPQVWNR